MLLVALVINVIDQKLLDKVDMGENHAPTAIPSELKPIEGLPLADVLLEHLQPTLPQVPNHLATGETTNWHDHF